MYFNPCCPHLYRYLILIVFLSGKNSTAQSIKTRKQLSEASYAYLEEKADSSYSVKSIPYAEAWLAKAKTEKNFLQLTMAYRAILFLSDTKERFIYADSLLMAAKDSKDNDLIGKAYLTKGILYYDKKELDSALDNYLLADRFISQTGDQYAIHKVKYSIAHTKYYLGFYEEAISLFRECITYFEEENDTAYLNALHSIGLCYTKVGEYDVSSHYNRIGLQAGIEFGNFEMAPYFRHSEGINNYFRKQYTQAVKDLEQVLPEIINRKDFANQTIAFFYIGKCYWELRQEEKALVYFNKVDKAFLNNNYIKPELRENYTLLIDFYKKKHNPVLQLVYINRLLKVDSILSVNYKYLSKRIFSEYDTQKLLLQKKQIEEALQSNNRTHYVVITALLLVTASLTYRHRKNRKVYSRRFRELMEEKKAAELAALKDSEPVTKDSKENEDTNNSKTLTDVGINPELTLTLLENLELFESEKKYLEKEMGVHKVAGYLNTNPKYASKIILKYRKKKTIAYIQDLKIDYIVGLLHTENKFRNYTNKSLAEEACFGSTQSFTKAFRQKMGMPPTFFVQELKKSNPL